MSKNAIVLIIINCIFSVKGFGPIDKKTWTYELKSLTSKSSNPSLLNFDLAVERISRGNYAISGTMNLDVDIADGDGNELGMKCYRSANGDNDYKILPMQISLTHINKAINTYYKDLTMKSVQNCSNLPYFENKFEPPLERKTYTLTKCQFSQEGYPNHLQEGFYKLLIYGIGAVEWEIEVVVEVQPNI